MTLKQVYQPQPVVPQIQTNYASNLSLLNKIFNNEQDYYTVKKHIPVRQQKQVQQQKIVEKNQIQNTFASPINNLTDQQLNNQIEDTQILNNEIIDSLLQTVKNTKVIQNSQSSPEELQHLSLDSQNSKQYIEVNQSEIDDILQTEPIHQQQNQNKQKTQKQQNQVQKQQKINQKQQTSQLQLSQSNLQSSQLQQNYEQLNYSQIQKNRYQNYLKPTVSSLNKSQTEKKVPKKQLIQFKKMNKQSQKTQQENQQEYFRFLTASQRRNTKINGDFAFRFLDQIDENHVSIEIIQLSTQNRVRRVVDLKTYHQLTEVQ